MIESSGILLLLLSALAAVPFLLRRFRSTAPDAVRVVGRTALHKNAVVAVVAIGDRRMLVGAGEKGVQLLAQLDDAPATTEVSSTMTSHDRTDAVGTGTTPATSADGALDAFTGAVGGQSIAGPGIGLLDRLRAMTVRTPVQGRPLHVPLRR